MHNLVPTDSLATLIGAPTGLYQPDLQFEKRLMGYGQNIVAGIDEAGRGPLAGPVVAAAVILDMQNTPDGLNDSKKLSVNQRNGLYRKILQSSIVAVAATNADIIDSINIRQATLISMSRAVHSMATKVDWCLIDGRDIPADLEGRATAIIKGDGRSKSIAAASIIAKVVRDAIMVRAAQTYCDYGFERHKGYATKAHLSAIQDHGPCPLHRLSFAPFAHKPK